MLLEQLLREYNFGPKSHKHMLLEQLLVEYYFGPISHRSICSWSNCLLSIILGQNITEAYAPGATARGTYFWAKISQKHMLLEQLLAEYKFGPKYHRSLCSWSNCSWSIILAQNLTEAYAPGATACGV